jgi:predicted RNA binding protein YcfA (HicA-like mRNA interferase family)
MEIIDKSATGHKIVINPETGATTELPTHGGRKQLKSGTMNAILKALGLK